MAPRRKASKSKDAAMRANLCGLPDELVHAVCQHLVPRDVLSLRAVNRHLRACVRSLAMASARAKLRLLADNRVLHAFDPGTLTVVRVATHSYSHACPSVRHLQQKARRRHAMSLLPAHRRRALHPTNSVASGGLVLSPHVPHFAHVELSMPPGFDTPVDAADMADLVRHLRDLRSLAAPLAALNEVRSLLHLTALSRLAVLRHKANNGSRLSDLDCLLTHIAKLPSLRVLVLKHPPLLAQGVVFGGPPAVAPQLDLGRSDLWGGGVVGSMCLEELEIDQPGSECDLGLFSGMHSLKRLRLNVLSLELERAVALDLPRLESVHITTQADGVVPLELPSLQTLHVSISGDTVSVVGALCDAPQLKSLVLLVSRVKASEPADIGVEGALDLCHLEHVEVHQCFLGRDPSLWALSHVRSIVILDWNLHELQDVDADLECLHATEHLSIRLHELSSAPAIERFAVLPSLARLSLTAERRAPDNESVDSPVVYPWEGCVAPASLPCHLFTRLERLELSVPWIHSGLRLTEAMPCMAELHLIVDDMDDVHPSWTRMVPGLRRLTLTLRRQEALECEELEIITFAAAGCSNHTGSRQGGGSSGTSRKGRRGHRSSSSSSSRRRRSNTIATTSPVTEWSHVQRLHVDAPLLGRLEWGWLKMFPDLLVLRLDAPQLSDYSSLPSRGSGSLPPKLFEVHVGNYELAQEMHEQQKQVYPGAFEHARVHVLHPLL